MKTALVAGATGLVGKQLILQLINDLRYEKVILLSRREIDIKHPKLDCRIIDFNRLHELVFDERIDDCFCALGTTMKKSGREGMIKVDRDYVIELGKVCVRNHIGRYLIVSSQMANANSGNFYLKTKGQMEQEVKRLGVDTIYVLRPSLLVGNREEFRFTEEMGYYLYKAFSPLMIGKYRKLRAIRADKVAKCLIELAQNDEKGYFILESDVIETF
jgi:uncharacterized protein YbjT (DUF2867 family)